MPVSVPDLGDAPPLLRRRFKHRAGDRGIDHGCFVTRRIMRQPDIIVAEDGNAKDVQTHHHSPVLDMDAQGSAGSSWPSCSSSTEILSGVRTKAMCPSRGGRLIVTPASISRSEEHTSELQSLMRISYAVFCLKKTQTSD